MHLSFPHTQKDECFSASHRPPGTTVSPPYLWTWDPCTWRADCPTSLCMRLLSILGVQYPRGVLEPLPLRIKTTTVYCNWGQILQGGNPCQGYIYISKSASCWPAWPSNKASSLKATRLSSEAKFCCSSYSSLVETKQLCPPKAQGENPPCWWLPATPAVPRGRGLHGGVLGSRELHEIPLGLLSLSKA